MINNYIIGPEKLVLFVDHVSYEPIHEKIINNIIVDKATIKTFPHNSSSFPKQHTIDDSVAQLLAGQEEKSNILLPPLSILTQQNKLEAVVKNIHQIKCSSKTKQLFVWATAKNIHDKKVIPFVEYLADIVVTLRDKDTLTILIKRNSGSVTKKRYQYELDKSCQINLREVKGSVDEKPAPEPTIDPESLATFKINAEEEELVARNAMKLPYERTSDVQQPTGPKIIYNPDSDDDFDEEDPDEDLYI